MRVTENNYGITATGSDAGKLFTALVLGLDGVSSNFSTEDHEGDQYFEVDKDAYDAMVATSGGGGGSEGEGSVKDDMPKQKFPKFSVLWKNYPHKKKPSDPHAHPSKDGYENQCAIRVGFAMILSGVDFSSYTEPISSEGYPRGAHSLALWIGQEFRAPEIISFDDLEKNMEIVRE